MLTVNIIEFRGARAVINSSSDPALDGVMIAQRDQWASDYPCASVQMLRMSYQDCFALNKAERYRCHGPLISALDIARASNWSPQP